MVFHHTRFMLFAFTAILLVCGVGCSSCSGKSQGKAVKPGKPEPVADVSAKPLPEPMSDRSILAHALEAAEAVLVPTVGQQPNLTFKSTLLAEIADAYARAGKFDQALSMVEKATKNDNPGLQAEALARIAAGHLKAGMVDETAALVDRIAKIKDWQSSPALALVARACAEAGKIDLAEQAADLIESGGERASAFLSLAQTLIEKGNDVRAAELIHRAIKAAKTAEPLSYDIQEPGSDMRIWVSDSAPAFALLRDAAEAFVKAGRLEEAEQVADMAENFKGDHFWKGNVSGWKAGILLVAADGYLKAKKKDKALEILTQALAGIDAMTAEKVGDTELKTSLYLDAARLWNELGEKEKSSKLLQSALDEAKNLQKVDVADIRVANGCAALARVAGAYSDLGKKDKAVEILEEAANIVASEKKVSKYGGDKDRAVAMGLIAAGLVGAGESARADKLFAKASDTAAKVKDLCWKAQAQADLVDIYLELGEHDQAKKAAAALQTTLKGTLSSCWVGGGQGFKRLIESMDARDQGSEIMAVADLMDPSWYKVEALAGVAARFEKAGKKAMAKKAVLEALEAVAAEKDQWARELLLVANTCPSSGSEADPDIMAVLEKIMMKKP
jgi:tetratricopeptide (TPR) repeat protein